MSKKDWNMLVSFIVTVLVAALMALAGGSNSVSFGSLSLFSWCVIIAFAINWLAFIPAMKAQTEHYYDFTGALTYVTVVVFAVAFGSSLDIRSSLAALMVLIWSIRLGSFLFARVKRYGKDDRFDEMKTKFWNFLVAWTVQALWVVVTAACALAIITSQDRVAFSWVGALGAALWVVGFGIEVVADKQKALFKRDPANASKFINTGLWARSRHPNYFGEIVLWIGMAIIAVPVLKGWQWWCLISPIFVYFLLRYVSGVPDLQDKAERKWGADPEFVNYRNVTPLFVPSLKLPN